MVTGVGASGGFWLLLPVLAVDLGADDTCVFT